MCGKGETVQLLLDKGVSLELKDGKERSVLDLLAEFPAERAKEIRRMIEGETLAVFLVKLKLFTDFP